MDQSKLNRLINQEAAIITQTLQRRGVDAGTRPGMATVCGGSHLFYKIGYGRSETVARVERFLPEIDEALTRFRNEPIRTRPARRPLGIEVPHPAPHPLRLKDGLPDLEPHQMLAGRRYDLAYGAPADITIDLDKQPHTLVAGVTGAGKSVAMQGLLLSLCANTSPADLEILVIDLKNEEGADLIGLPHVRQIAVSIDGARNIIERVHAIKDERVHSGRWTGSRLLLVIDEMAEVYQQWKDSEKLLGSIASIGRSKGVNLLIGTQKPTKDAVGKLGGFNFTQRLAGMVNHKNESYFITGIDGMNAHLLPGPGSFICTGVAIGAMRLQTYLIEPDEVVEHMRQVRAVWHSVPKTPDVSQETPAQTAVAIDPAVAAVTSALAGYETASMPASDLMAIAAFVVEHHERVQAGEWSKAEMIRQAYSAGMLTSAVTGGRNANLFRDALEAVGKIPETPGDKRATERATKPAFPVVSAPCVASSSSEEVWH